MSGLSPVPRIPKRCSTMNGSEASATRGQLDGPPAAQRPAPVARAAVGRRRSASDRRRAADRDDRRRAVARAGAPSTRRAGRAPRGRPRAPAATSAAARRPSGSPARPRSPRRRGSAGRSRRSPSRTSAASIGRRSGATPGAEYVLRPSEAGGLGRLGSEREESDDAAYCLGTGGLRRSGWSRSRRRRRRRKDYAATALNIIPSGQYGSAAGRRRAPTPRRRCTTA